MIREYTNQQGKQFVFVKVSENSTLRETRLGDLIIKHKRGSDIYSKERVVGLAKELTEEQWKNIVNRMTFSFSESYLDYSEYLYFPNTFKKAKKIRLILNQITSL